LTVLGKANMIPVHQVSGSVQVVIFLRKKTLLIFNQILTHFF